MKKIIHYFFDDINIWEKNCTPQFRMCYASWLKFCSNYEIMLWHKDMPEFKEILKKSKFVRICYKLKMWAFIADYIRHYALYNYGGIYLDTDVQLLDNFDKYLEKPFFCSIEGDIIDGENIPESAVIGGEKGHQIFKYMLDLYDSDEIFNINFPIDPIVLKQVLKDKTNFCKIAFNESVQDKIKNLYNSNVSCEQIKDIEIYKNQKIFKDEKYNIEIYPSEYFCPSWNSLGENAFTENTVSIHWGQCSWWSKKNKIRILESYRYKNPVKRVWYQNSERIAKILTCTIPNKNIRHKIRNLITK